MSIKLDKKDVIAIADSRVFRRIKKKIYYGLAVAIVFIVCGACILEATQTVSIVLFVCGLAILYGGLFIMERRQKRERKALLKEWGEE